MSEPPSDDGRRSRSDAASRLAAMLADTDDDLVLPDDPAEGADERASDPPATPSAASIAARPAPVQPQPEQDRGRRRRPGRAAAAGAAGAAAGEPTRRVAVADLLGDVEPAPVVDRADDIATPAAGPEPTTDGGADSDAPTPVDGDTDAPEPGADPDAGTARTAPSSDNDEADGPTAGDDLTAAPEVGADPDAGTARTAPRSQSDDAPADDEVAPAAAAAARSRTRSDDDGPEPVAPAPKVPEVRLRRVTLRAVAFGTVLALLVVAVPALAWVGKERLLDSKGGDVVGGGTDSTAPGYRALVIPTDTALVLQRDDEGTIVATTLFALGAGSAGGTVLQIPMNTKVREQKFLFDRLSLVAANSSDELYAKEVADLLNVAIPANNVISIDDESMASLSAPVAPLVIDNPDPVVTDEGEEIPAGQVELDADQVGPYMRASAGGEDELARLARNETVWSTWLGAVGDVGVEVGVGQGFTDIGPFIRTLAAGEPVVETLNVTLPAESDQPDPPYVPAEGFDEQILDAVPYPMSPGPGRRWELVLLNGASGDDEIPRDLMRQLIGQGAALTTLGNAAVMGKEGTLVEYGGSQWKDAAERASFVLGGDAEVSRMSQVRAEQAGADVVITVGSDTLERFGGGG